MSFLHPGCGEPSASPRIRSGASRAVLWSLAAATCALGCMTTQVGRIYNMRDGRSAPLVANDPQAYGGELHASLPTGESCRGQFSEVDVDEASRLNLAEVPLSENAEASLAVLFCGRDHVLRCTLARRENEGFSYGACRDRLGNEFSLMF